MAPIITFIETAEPILKLIGFLTATILFVIGIRRYRRAQIWKKKAFVAREFDKFNNDHRIRATKHMLDWAPARVELFHDHPEYEKRFVEVTHQKMLSALSRHQSGQDFTPEEMAIRDHFDYFLDYLEKFQQFIESGLISSQHVQPYLHYWVKKIHCDDDGEEKYRIGEELRRAMHDYIDRYNFYGIRQLFAAMKCPLD